MLRCKTFTAKRLAMIFGLAEITLKGGFWILKNVYYAGKYMIYGTEKSREEKAVDDLKREVDELRSKEEKVVDDLKREVSELKREIVELRDHPDKNNTI